MSAVVNEDEFFVELAHVVLKLFKLFFTVLFFALEADGVDDFVRERLVLVGHLVPLFLEAFAQLGHLLLRKQNSKSRPNLFFSCSSIYWLSIL